MRAYQQNDEHTLSTSSLSRAMDWKTGYRNNRGKLLVIGASALVLALIAFSGVCLGTLQLCGLWNAASTWGFWEFFGVLSVVVATSLAVRPFRKRNAARPDAVADYAVPLSPLTEPAIAPEVAIAAADSITPSEPIADLPTRSNWRDLYDQLSREEQKAFKAVMGKYLGKGRSEG